MNKTKHSHASESFYVNLEKRNSVSDMNQTFPPGKPVTIKKNHRCKRRFTNAKDRRFHECVLARIFHRAVHLRVTFLPVISMLSAARHYPGVDGGVVPLDSNLFERELSPLRLRRYSPKVRGPNVAAASRNYATVIGSAVDRPERN